jgi:PAS domain S-box-containing protein
MAEMNERPELYQLLVEEVQDYALLMLDPDGRIASWNKGATRVLGYDEADILGRHFSLLFTPEDRAAGVPERELRDAAATGRVPDDRWHLRGDGRRIFVTGVTTALRDDAGRLVGFGKLMHDLTGRLEAERRLTAQFEVTRTLATSTEFDEAVRQILEIICTQLGWDWGALWQPVASGGGVTTLRCTQTWRRQGQNRDEFERVSRCTELPPGVGLPGRIFQTRQAQWIADVTRGENFPRAVTARDDVLHGAVGFPILLGDRVLGVIEFLSRDAREPDEHLLRVMGTIGGQLGQFIERTRAERELRGSEALKSAILRAALDCIITMDHRGNVVEWNPAAQRTFGYAREEAVGRQLSQLIIPPSIRPLHHAGLARYLATGAGPVIGRRIELVGMRKGGEEFPIELAITRIGDSDPPTFTAYLRDITERKRAEEERAMLLRREQESRTQAESANRAKDEFLAVVSHELRTPLTAVLGWARLLRSPSSGLDEEMRQEGIEAIERNAQAQAQLVEDILDVSRIITGKLRLQVKPIEIEPVITLAVQSVRPAAEARGVEIRTTVPATPLVVLGDAERLQQVVWNLLSNAIKFTDRGGRVELALEQQRSRVRITVNDTGRGIRRDFLPYVFDRFRQSEGVLTRRYGGLGLGLAIVRHLVELHGGNVQVESAGEGQGATFTIELPVIAVNGDAGPAGAPPQRRTHSASPQFTCPPIMNGLRVLVVDDEADSRRLVATVLERCLATVRTAGSAEEAMEVLREGPPDVMVSDIGMPGEDGFSLIQRVRALELERGIKVPAVALTAYTRVEDRMRALAAGYQMFIPKPVEPVELITIVANLAGRADLLNAARHPT